MSKWESRIHVPYQVWCLWQLSMQLHVICMCISDWHIQLSCLTCTCTYMQITLLRVWHAKMASNLSDLWDCKKQVVRDMSCECAAFLYRGARLHVLHYTPVKASLCMCLQICGWQVSQPQLQKLWQSAIDQRLSCIQRVPNNVQAWTLLDAPICLLFRGSTVYIQKCIPSAHCTTNILITLDKCWDRSTSGSR